MFDFNTDIDRFRRCDYRILVREDRRGVTVRRATFRSGQTMTIAVRATAAPRRTGILRDDVRLILNASAARIQARAGTKVAFAINAARARAVM